MKDFYHHAYRRLAAIALLTITTGMVVYHYVEKLSWLNAYYFSVTTLATVGYGDITPKTNVGKIFTTFYMLIGVGIFTTFISATVKKRGEKLQQRSSTENDALLPSKD